MFLLLMACNGAAQIDDLTPVTDTADTEADTGDAADTADTGDTGTEQPDYDCEAVPSSYSTSTVAGAKAYHGIAFNADGDLVGWDGRNTLTTSAYGESATPWVPGMQVVEQIVEHPSGDLFTLSANELIRISPEGGQERILGGLFYGYGLTFAPDGMLWVADGGLHRVDIETGEMTKFIPAPGPDDWQANLYRDVAFSLDSKRLYVVSTSNKLEYWDLDEDLEPIGALKTFAIVPGSWKDGLMIDACGYFWLPDYQRSVVYRVDPDGEKTIQAAGGTEKSYPHALSWGGGGDWSQTSLFLPLPYNQGRVVEVEIGVPDGASVRTWKGEKSRF
ncbi:MAG: streptogramin lyase [Cognaticolwellia sp.]|jgi:streptogramin lyase